MQLSFEQKLISIFLLFFSAIGLAAYLTYQNDQAFTANDMLVNHTEEVLRESEKVRNITKDLAGAKAYYLKQDPAMLKSFNRASKQVFYDIGVLKDLTRDNPDQQLRIDTLKGYVQHKIDLISACITLIDNNQMDKARALLDSFDRENARGRLPLLIDDMQKKEAALLEIRKAAYTKSKNIYSNTIRGLFAGLMILLIGTFVAIKVNLNSRKRLERELSSANRFLNTILENLPNMIFVKDAKDLKFLRFNRAGEKLLGQSREKLIGKNDYDFFPKTEADFFTAKDREVLNNGSLVDIREEVISTPAGKRWLHTKKIPITDELNRPQYLLGISEDITDAKRSSDEIKQLNEELSRTVEQLILANKEMEAFTYSVSHDLRAPLRIIDGFGEILIKDYSDRLNEDALQTLKVISSNAKHMGQLIDDLLNLSRLGRTQVTMRRVEMYEMVSEVVDALKVLDPGFKSNIQINALKPAECDASLMRQVWFNLISNAVKYSRKQQQPEIEIGCTAMEGQTVYYVKDNGVGFDMKYYNKLFGVFQRLHKVSEFEGTGVGLALVQRIVNKHNGRVWAEAKENEGATFYFTLNN